jgi:signal transduction histidine kinase
VILAGLVMFHMHDDVKVLAVAAASASTAVAAALLLGGGLARRIAALAGAAGRISGGELHARAPASGPRELADVGRAFNEMASSLEQLFDARRELVAAASHDLRTPVSAIQAMLEAADDGLVPIEHYLPALQEQTRFLALLIDDLFELARIDAAALRLDLEEARLPQIVDACVRGLDAEARARRVRLASELDDDLPAVRCAPEQVQRVLFNLLTNALRHTPSDGSVVVRARVAAEELEVLVEDTGSGLAAGAEQRVFDRFWRADGSRTRSTGGAGLGLAIARGFVEAQGGRIWAENRSGGGARFAFTLPVAS